MAGVSGKVGNLNGKTVEGGNPFEGWRAADYCMPPMPLTYDATLFAETTKKMGYHPFPRPGAI